MGKRYRSVEEMVRATASPEYAKEFEEYVDEHSVSRALFVLRNQAGLTQTELAKRVDWRQNRVSRLESTPNSRIRLGELEQYVNALGTSVTIQVGGDRRRKAVEIVKCAAFEINDQLGRLAEMAHGDSVMEASAKKFFLECLYNVLSFVRASLRQLSDEGDRLLSEGIVVHHSGIYVCTPDDDEDDPGPGSTEAAAQHRAGRSREPMPS